MAIGEQDLNPKKLEQMKVEILKAERENLKTREKSTDAMIESLRKIIVTETKKNF
ncbi:MAG: hypothetical protein LBE89_04670 [Helicobacteraceae bacterium]|jgi:hypothetical protein|nr:hypothetical protein [Helicobacteraceae bacterium]